MLADHYVYLTPCAVLFFIRENHGWGKKSTSLKLCVLASCAKAFLFNGQICGFLCSLFVFQQSFAFQTPFSRVLECWKKGKAVPPPPSSSQSTSMTFFFCSGCELDGTMFKVFQTLCPVFCLSFFFFTPTFSF